MGNWFDEQIKERKDKDRQQFSDVFRDMGNAIMGKKVLDAYNKSKVAVAAMEEILGFYNIKKVDVPEEIEDPAERIDYIIRPSGLMRRNVKLTKGWYKNAIGAMLGTVKETGNLVVLVPHGFKSYYYCDFSENKKIVINSSNEQLLDDEAIAFYRPFPQRKMSVKDLLIYAIERIRVTDLAVVIAFMGITTLVGMLLPYLNKILFSDVLNSKSISGLIATMIFILSVQVSSQMFGTIQTLMNSKINLGISLNVEAAAMMRVMSLKPSFYRQYSSGELNERTHYVGNLCTTIINTVLNTGISSVFSLIYITQIFSFAPGLLIPAIMVTLATVIFSVVATLAQIGLTKRSMELSAKQSGMSFAMITGIQKIRLAGAEMRAFARWGELYTQNIEITYNPPMFIKINQIITTAISLVGTIVMYFFAIKTKVSVADYYAFQTAYGMVSGAFMSLAGIALTAASIKPTMEMAKPILDAEPEETGNKDIVTRISGRIELNNVSFRYNDDMPMVLDNLSLKIDANSYVAIVGKTGCGKSTLMRLLLGFETPIKGAVYYDGRDINTIDLKSLRRKIGTVIQNGKLFSGSIYSNIVITDPRLSQEEAWEAAEIAGVADDIRRMPMKMHTLISEGAGGVSGGQKQRLLIARAVAPKPKVLMFDEATSALDNITQKKVSEALDKMKCTRIVIAHRLSTIKNCDRIIMLEGGKIVEDGTYDELIALGGKFAEMVERQRVD
ncbi:MAG: ATP-binding cassette domain-containing protein [Lachnospiraceae bacterium]|nr:ATP-binding cassette domain-containing protein [Lachnospiraceae bacterium]